MQSNLIFFQLYEKESSTYTYLLGDVKTAEAVIIDPVYETRERDLKLINELGLKLKYVLETHVHADHITGSGELRNRTGAKIALNGAYSASCSDIALNDKSEITFGSHKITAISTPGHTKGCMTYHLDNMLFTGDALLIRGCGRTDFQDGSPETLFHSVRDKIFSYPDETFIYPAHDYKGLNRTTVGLEKKLNPRLKLENSKEDFVKIMSELKLDYPKKLQVAVPANMQCGLNIEMH